MACRGRVGERGWRVAGGVRGWWLALARPRGQADTGPHLLGAHRCRRATGAAAASTLTRTPQRSRAQALSPSAPRPSLCHDAGTNRAQFALLDGVDALKASPQLQAARQQAQKELALRTAAAEQVGSG